MRRLIGGGSALERDWDAAPTARMFSPSMTIV